MIKLHDAILKLMPSAEVTVINENEIIWGENCLNNHPTEKAIQAKLKELQDEYDANQYQRDRAVAYDPIPEQLDQIYHDMDGWKARIKAVKDKYPKPK